VIKKSTGGGGTRGKFGFWLVGRVGEPDEGEADGESEGEGASDDENRFGGEGEVGQGHGR